MKKTVIMMVALLGLVSTTEAVQVRLGLEAATGLQTAPTRDTVIESFSNNDALFTGLRTEVIIGRVGLGFTGLTNFTDTNKTWQVNWMGETFLSYHLFGSDGFLDPYVQAGLANSGRVDITNGVENLNGTLSGINLSLHPNLTAGVNLRLDGLLVGVKSSYSPYNWRLPAAPIEKLQISPFQVGFFLGVGLGDNKPSSQSSDCKKEVELKVLEDEWPSM